MPGRYFGGKNERSAELMLRLFPKETIKTYVDCFFGMGNATRNLACGMSGTQRIGYELERSLYVMHEVIKSDRVYELIDRIKGVENTRANFENALDMVKAYNDRIKYYPEIDIALAELMSIRFSMNCARNSWRNIKSYESKAGAARERSKRELEAIERKFYTQMPVELLELHYQWQKVSLFNENSMENMARWAGKGTFYFVDPPYLPNKRGLDCASDSKPNNKGYLEDMSANDHEKLIDLIMKLSKTGSWFMICSNFELDAQGRLIGIADDPYTKLLEHGFRLAVVEKKYSTAIKHQMCATTQQHKKPKVEVVYVNYHQDILDCWETIPYMDYEDILRGKEIRI